MLDLSKLSKLIEVAAQAAPLLTKKSTKTKETKSVYLFFSLDLSNSTTFKSEYPALWAHVITNFYTVVLSQLGVGSYRSADTQELNASRHLWKLVGDEVLVYVQVHSVEEIYRQVKQISDILPSILPQIVDETHKSICAYDQKGCSCLHDQEKYQRSSAELENIIQSVLGVKATAWIAECYESPTIDRPNIVYRPMYSDIFQAGESIDFLGRDVDEGFRLTKLAVKNKLIVSPLLAWLIWQWANPSDEGHSVDLDRAKYVNANFRITAFTPLKGVWRGRSFPIVMFHQEFQNFASHLEYDELDHPAYGNVKRVGLQDFFKDSRFEIRALEHIFRSVGRELEAKALYQGLENNPSTQEEISVKEHTREIHVACAAITASRQILVHKDPKRGLEFGCIKVFSLDSYSGWRDLAIRQYRSKYQLEIDLPENPTPVATYTYKKSQDDSEIAFGIILLADYKGDAANLPQDWQLYSQKEIMEIVQNELCVENFAENTEWAFQLMYRQTNDTPESVNPEN